MVNAHPVEKAPVAFKNFPATSCSLLLTRLTEKIQSWTSETLREQVGSPTSNEITRLVSRDKGERTIGDILLIYADPHHPFYETNKIETEYFPAQRALGLAVILANPDNYGDVGKELTDFATNAQTREQFRHCVRVSLAADIEVADRLTSEFESRLTRTDLDHGVRLSNLQEHSSWEGRLEVLQEIRNHVKEQGETGEPAPIS